jgi:hypothetical protein
MLNAIELLFDQLIKYFSNIYYYFFQVVTEIINNSIKTKVYKLE